MSFIEEEQAYWLNLIKKCGFEVESVTLSPSARKELGDYQYNGAMNLAGKLHKNPREIAGVIVEALQKDYKVHHCKLLQASLCNY